MRVGVLCLPCLHFEDGVPLPPLLLHFGDGGCTLVSQGDELFHSPNAGTEEMAARWKDFVDVTEE